jgi:carbon-monoxide dehydrogenase large subunit
MTDTLQTEKLGADQPQRKLVGQSVLRREDLALLTGTARFIDDIRLPGMVYAKFLRATTGHARLQRVDVSAALEMPGVRAALCG